MEDYLFTNLLDGMCGFFMAQTSDEICKRKGVSREETDEFAALSHSRTANSIDNDIWEQEIVKVGEIGHKDEDHVMRQHPRIIGRVKNCIWSREFGNCWQCIRRGRWSSSCRN